MKKVRVTLELPERFIRLLNAKATLSGWTKWLADSDKTPPELDAGDLVAWLILQEARGAPENDIHMATPMMWRDCNSPELIHDERRVYDDDQIISGTTGKKMII